MGTGDLILRWWIVWSKFEGASLSRDMCTVLAPFPACSLVVRWQCSRFCLMGTFCFVWV
jgi:hypothetical protein